MAARNTKTPRRYSDSEKAHALAAVEANGGNVLLTAKELGIPRGTLEAWANGRIHPEVQMLQQEYKLSIVDRLDKTIHQLLDSIPTKINEAPLKHTMDSLAIAVDRKQLLMGEPTSIAAKASTDEQLISQLQRLATRLRQPATAADPAESGQIERS